MAFRAEIRGREQHRFVMRALAGMGRTRVGEFMGFDLVVDETIPEGQVWVVLPGSFWGGQLYAA